MMPEENLQYLVPQGISRETLKSSLAERYPIKVEPERRIGRGYYDSFDWRLFQAGGLLTAESADQGYHLSWRALDEGRLIDSEWALTLPTFAADLRPGCFRDRLAALLQMRALLLQVRVESRVQTLRLLDKDEKTVLRLGLEANSYVSPDGAAMGPLTGRIRLFPVKGYPKPLERMHRFLRYDLGLQPASGDLMLEVMEVLGRRPGEYSSKLNFHFDPLMRSDVVAKQIQRHLLDTLEANIGGARQDLDTEFLHDLRVATRRARSALTQIKGVFGAAEVARFKERLAWIGRITGPTRDMDVYLLGFEDYRNSLPAAVRSDLDPLRDFLSAHHKSEQARLAAQLESPDFQTLLREWRAFLETPVPVRAAAPNASRPIGELASERIYKIYKRVLREGLAIGSDTPAAQYHELRKNCKKLRYLMEFFGSLYPRRRIRRLIKALKALLDNLGEFQDLEVQADKLRGFGRDMLTEGNVPAATLLAMGMLVDGLLRRQQQARDAFAQRFAVFAEPENRRSFKQLFASHPKGLS